MSAHTNNIVRGLQRLINNYNEESIRLDRMVDRWISYDDPDCDPGLQYEQEAKVDAIFMEISEYVKQNF